LQLLRADVLWTNHCGSFPTGRNLKVFGSPETTKRVQYIAEMGSPVSLK
jgi:hypothetical protein